jgi:hypothetical protein
LYAEKTQSETKKIGETRGKRFVKERLQSNKSRSVTKGKDYEKDCGNKRCLTAAVKYIVGKRRICQAKSERAVEEIRALLPVKNKHQKMKQREGIQNTDE